jgi:hypothetical protein
VLAFIDQALQFDGGVGMFGVDGDDLPQALLTFGIIRRNGRQPHPGIFIARLGDEDEVE